MSRHTPGPWQINTGFGKLPPVRRVKMPHNEADTFQSRIESVDRKHVCRLDFGYGKKGGEDEANARLIAAAPDMLNDLMWIRDHARDVEEAKGRAMIAIQRLMSGT